jgi:hypothetical protein
MNWDRELLLDTEALNMVRVLGDKLEELRIAQDVPMRNDTYLLSCSTANGVTSTYLRLDRVVQYLVTPERNNIPAQADEENGDGI